VLPSESRQAASDFLSHAGGEIESASGGMLRLAWAFTENLGDWAIVRRRLTEEMHRKRGTLAEPAGPQSFEPFPLAPVEEGGGYFSRELGLKLTEAQRVGWSPETPARILLGEGKHQWSLTSVPDSVPLARHTAPSDDGTVPADCATLAGRAAGRPVWGVLRGDVDGFAIRLRRVQSIEEHVQLSILYKQFFAGELEVLCSMPEFWRKVSVLYSGGDDFAAYGSWDALILLAREMHRLFRRFSEESLKDFPGAEGKTISMALALAGRPDASLDSVFDEAGWNLEAAKCENKDSFALFGRVLEWRHIASASDLKDLMARIVIEFGGSSQFLREVSAFYKDTSYSGGLTATARRRSEQVERPWLYHARVGRALPAGRDRELEKLRTSLIVELIGKNAAQAKLRPAGQVALEWARLHTEA
jgi:CRISPR-associated protein Csm1